MANDYPITVDQIHDATNGGLDIYNKYLSLPANVENCKVKFKYRESEKTASCVLLKKDDIFFLKDFGDKVFSPVTFVQDKFGLDFGAAIKLIAQDFNLLPGQTLFRPEKDFSDTELKEGYFKVVFKDYKNLSTIGPYVTAELATEYAFKEIDYYEKVIISSKTDRETLLRVTATDQYPIFAYLESNIVGNEFPVPAKGKNKINHADFWCKLYEPKAVKNEKGFSSKHSYLGKKPERYVYGLQRLMSLANYDRIVELKKTEKETKDYLYKKELQEEISDLMIDSVFILSGGTDGLNCASLDNNVIWFGSESEQINYTELEQLKTVAKSVYNIPDIDKPGEKYGKDVAEKYWELQSIWLPKEKMTTNGKDFRDWMNFYKSSKKEELQRYFRNLLPTALKCKFFDKKTAKNGSVSYKINLSNLHYFLNVKNYYTYKIQHKQIDVATDEQIIFVNIQGNVVTKVSTRDIRRFCLNYIKEKGQKIDIANLVLSTPYFNENHLMGLSDISLSFKNYDSENQFFFFKNQVVKISSAGVELKKHGTADNYTWNKSIIDHNILPEEKFFEYKKDDLGRDRVTILRQDCDYQNYLINGSRVFWRKDLEEPFTDAEKKREYHEKNKFNLNGSNLTEIEQIKQEQHYLSKCFALGYLAHRYKRQSFAKLIYVTDNAVKDSVSESKGRSGKSVMFVGLDYLLQNRFFINGKDKNLTTNNHILQGLTENNDYLLLEDIDRYLSLEFLYTWITSSVKVNPKNSGQYELSFFEFPKVAITSNFGIPNLDASTLGRLYIIAFSDYYHAKTDEYQEERRISHDFDGKELYTDWKSDQWNKFYNFLFQCCEFYLQNRHSEILAPQENITINNLKAGIGDSFIEWAGSYFIGETLNVAVPRREMMADYKLSAGKSSKSAQAFKASLQNYCKLNGWTFNPVEAQRKSDGRVVINVYDNSKQKNTTVECFFIKTPDVPVSINQDQQPETGQADIFNNTNVDADVPF